jgi:ABC-type Mn2+/Zn2+ transport system ATPase subunit
LERGDDAITYRIYREDGSLAGPIENVSAGQKGLAFLNLLLASGDMPLLVDTPEEGLDNEGVYSELVPIFRREKEKRQIFVITHNANIPVNADAELIACLEPCGTIERTKLEEILTASGGSSDSVDLDHLARSLSE